MEGFGAGEGAALPPLKFDERGLITAVVQDATSREVLMVAWMSRESLGLTLSTGCTHFWSRSRRQLWKKGETSGCLQRVREVRADCDADTLLVLVDQTGPACHTGSTTCFFTSVTAADKGPPASSGSPAPPAA